MKHLAIVINWYGPYSLDDARQVARIDYSSGLYLGIGKVIGGEGPSKPQYIGLSKNLGRRLARHHKLPSITQDAKIWLGEVATAEPGGKRAKVTQTTLDYAEWLHAYFMALELNEKKRKSPPDRAVSVFNRWWKKDYETPWLRRPHADWPDLIDYVGPDYPVWFGRRQRWNKPTSSLA